MDDVNNDDERLLRELADAGGSITEAAPGHRLRYARVVKAGYVFALTGASGTCYQLTRLGWERIDLRHD